jgi:hypothetical protein
MEVSTLVIKAARKKWRFATTKGHLAFEDLWDLKLEDLDKVAVALDEKIQKGGRKSFIAKRTESMTEEQGMLDLVSYVIETKMTEADEAKVRLGRRGQREFLEELKKKKQIAALEGLSLEDIEKQIAALGE